MKEPGEIKHEYEWDENGKIIYIENDPHYREKERNFYKGLIRSVEARLVDTKKRLADIGRNFNNEYPPDDETVIWIKTDYRESKASDERWLKELVEELTHFNQGMNPPYCYKSMGS